MGYVGLPLALRFSEVGIKVVGFDRDESKVTSLNNCKSYIERLQTQKIVAVQQNGFEATSDFSRTQEVDALIICVLTQLNIYREPDLSYAENSLAFILPYFKAGQLLSLESTTWPGTTAKNIASFDCIIIATEHDAFDYDVLLKNSQLIVDTRDRHHGHSKVVSA